MILLIDNYDSFTFNLFHFLGDVGARMEFDAGLAQRQAVRRRGHGDAAGGDRAVARPLHAERGRHLPRPDRRRRRQDPAARRLPRPPGDRPGVRRQGGARAGADARQGRPTSPTPARDIFAGLPSPFSATRYHSLIVERDTLPDTLVPTAWTEDGLIMAMHHRTLPIYGVQFHPESIASEHGHAILRNFLAIARGTNTPAPPAAPPEPCPPT